MTRCLQTQEREARSASCPPATSPSKNSQHYLRVGPLSGPDALPREGTVTTHLPLRCWAFSLYFQGALRVWAVEP